MSDETIAVSELGRLLLIMQAGDIGTWEWSVPDQTVSWSDKTQSLLGLTPGVPASREAFLSVLHPDDRSRLQSDIASAIKDAGQFSLDFRVRWPDGTLHWLLAKGQCFRDFMGSPTTLAGIVMDVTGQKQFAQKRDDLLQEAQRQREVLRRLFENAPIGIAIIDASTGRYLLANPTYESSPGRTLPPGSFIGHHVGEFATPELAEFMNHVLRQVIATKQPLRVREYETSFGQPGREYTWWNNDVVPLFDEQGNVESVLAITMEVTQEVLARKRIEELAAQMQASRDKLETIFNNMNEGLVVVDTTGRILSANPAAMQMHGATSLAEVPANIADYPAIFDMRYLDGRPIPYQDWPVVHALSGQTASGVELQGRRLDTGASWIACYSARPVRDQHGKITHLILAIHDLTTAKQAEQHLRQVMAELERSNQDLEQFAYVASHDLQEPLRMITGFLDLLTQRTASQLDTESNEYMRFATDGANRMSQLLKGLLMYSRVDTEGRKPQPTQAREALDEALANLRMAREESSAEIIVGDLPTVTVDRTQLIQLFQNLVGNAIKFRRPDENPRIEIGAEKQGAFWLFHVRDNGIGFPADQANRIFQIFQRLHKHGKFPGAGVGLAVCRKIVERHGGRIWAKSNPGQGSTFLFTLPA